MKNQKIPKYFSNSAQFLSKFLSNTSKMTEFWHAAISRKDLSICLSKVNELGYEPSEGRYNRGFCQMICHKKWNNFIC